ncbi:WYL domain-containing protein [Caminibacter sp.]
MPFLRKLKLIREENVFYSKLDIEKIKLFLFRKIEKAIKNRKIINMIYDLNGMEKEMQIKPLKISNFEEYWYVNALNHNDEYRTYHIKSIKNLEIIDKSFEVK